MSFWFKFFSAYVGALFIATGIGILIVVSIYIKQVQGLAVN